MNHSHSPFLTASIRGWTLEDLYKARESHYSLCEAEPQNVPQLLQALRQGRVEGWMLKHEDCRCICGWMFFSGDKREMKEKYLQHTASTIELLAIGKDEGQGIRPGDTPENSPEARLVVQWLEAWETERVAAAFAKVV